MISDIAEDLITKIKTVTVLNNRVGLAVGGKVVDPLMEKVPKPAVWVIYMGDEAQTEQDQGYCAPFIKMSFVVKVFVDYTNEKDLLDNQFPLLEDIINAVNGKSGITGAKNWKYEGQTIDEVASNRLVFDQRFSVVTVL